MVEKSPTPSRNVVDFRSFQAQRKAGGGLRLSARLCRHCGALLGEGDIEDECSTALIGAAPSYRLRAPRG